MWGTETAPDWNEKLLEISHLTKRYNGNSVLKDVSFRVAPGEILGLLGPSGCGKTTLLRVIAGLERPDLGRVILNGADITRVAPHLRRIGMMFQEYALFPHKNVLENVAYGLERQHRPRQEVQQRGREVLQLVGLQGFEERPVSALSGGEQQRVALARSLAPGPSLLLLDEPLGSLDRALRERLMLELRRILKAVGATAVSVTHDHCEAFALSDRVAVLRQGRLEQLAAPDQLYLHPANTRVAQFLGFSNLIPAVVGSNLDVVTELGTVPIDASGKSAGEPVTLLIRPDGGRIVAPGTDCGENVLVLGGEVKERLFQGLFYRLVLEVSGKLDLVFQLPLEPAPPAIGSRVRMAIAPAAVHLLDSSS